MTGLIQTHLHESHPAKYPWFMEAYIHKRKSPRESEVLFEGLRVLQRLRELRLWEQEEDRVGYDITLEMLDHCHTEDQFLFSIISCRIEEAGRCFSAECYKNLPKDKGS